MILKLMHGRGRNRRAGLLALLLGGAALIGIAVPAVSRAADASPVAQAKLELGRSVFVKLAQPQCGVCHTLKDAGTTGEIGARLEEIVPDEQRVLTALRQGVGIMPSYKDKLTPEQIEAVAYYVATAVRQDK